MGKKQIFAMFILIVLLFASCSGTEPSEIQLTDQAEETDIICDNPYFFSPDVSSLMADITFFDVDTEGYVTIRGDLELHWLRQYENGCIAKLSFVPFDHMPSYMLNGSIWGEEYDYSDIYFYVTSDKIYRINSRVIQDGENIYAYEDEKLFLDFWDSEEKIIENAELVCCPEGIESEYTGDNIGDDFITGEIGTHYEIVVSENQIAYCRQEYPAGHMEFYNSFVWENGRGLIEHKRGYRAGAMPLCIENITVNEGSESAETQTDMQTVVSENTENNKEVLQTQEIEGTETAESAVERLKAEIDSYFQTIEGEWVVVEYAGSISDHLAPEDYTEKYWEERETYINTKIEENLGKEYRIESDNLISVGAISDGTVIIEDDAMLSCVTCFFHPEIPLEAPYIGLSVEFQDDTDQFHSIIIDNNGIVLIEVGNCFFRMERKTETNSGGSM